MLRTHRILTKTKTVHYSTVQYTELYSTVLYSFRFGKNSIKPFWAYHKSEHKKNDKVKADIN